MFVIILWFMMYLVLKLLEKYVWVSVGYELVDIFVDMECIFIFVLIYDIRGESDFYRELWLFESLWYSSELVFNSI